MGITVQALLDLPPSKATQLAAIWPEPERCVQPAAFRLTPLPSPTPHGVTGDQRALQGNDLVIGGPSGVCFLPDWKRKTEGETPLSLYMMSVNATHFLSITFSVVFSSWFPGDMLYVCGQAVCDSCVSCTSWTRHRVKTKTPQSLNMLSFYWACYSADRRHWQCRRDWHATHSFTKEIYSKLLSQAQAAGWLTTRDSCMLEFHSISILFFFWYLHFLILTLFAKNHICTMTFLKMNLRLKGMTSSSHSGA